MTEPTPDATILDIAAPPLLAYYPVKPEELTLVSSEDDRHASYALPPGWTLQTVDNESKQPNPRRARGNVIFHGLDGFMEYVNAHKTGDHATTLWARPAADKVNLILEAVFNDHAADLCVPGWRDWTAAYSSQLDPDFSVWLGRNGRPFAQAEFGEFLEDYCHLITNFVPTEARAPSGADMARMARQMEIKHEAVFKSILYPESGGVDMTYTDGPDAASVQKMQAFDAFYLEMPIFRHSEPVILEARLRYKLSGGKLSFTYKLIGLTKAFDVQTRKLIADVAAATELPVWAGNPRG